MSYIHYENFRIRTSEINHRKQIHPHQLIQLMQEASMQHTLGMKVSVWDLESKNISWVLLKMDVYFYRYPSLGEITNVKTFPSGLDGFFTYRDYYVYDENGIICATASSMWTLMDTIERKMVKIPSEFGSLVYPSEELLPKPSKKLISPAITEEVSFIKVNFLHLDWNGHVNNVQLVKMIFESLDTDFHQNRILKTLSIQFKSEATNGQVLLIGHEYVSKSEVRHVIKNEILNRDVLLAITIWD
ncbi:MAG: hypothetical protein H7X99_00970 [Saprospiraceae bacterium]|nr:hypothetical protein [Saprospiraceae bacterium]